MNIDELVEKETRRLDEINDEELHSVASPVSTSYYIRVE